jgi:hypothetical protein
VKIAVLLLHLLLKATPLIRSIDISNSLLPFKAALVLALTIRDATGLSTPSSSLIDILSLIAAAVLIGLLLWPKPRSLALSAGQK